MREPTIITYRLLVKTPNLDDRSYLDQPNAPT